MKFWKNENLSDRYIPSKQKKKLLYIIHDRRKMRGKFFFFIKTKIFDLQYIQINFLRLKQRTKICATDCYVISHRFFPRFFNRDSNALVTYHRSKRNSIINNSGQSSLSSRDRRFEVLRDAVRNIFLSLVSYPPGEKHPSILCVYNAESWETPLQQ